MEEHAGGELIQAKEKTACISTFKCSFFAVFILFAELIFVLGVVQIVDGQEFVKELEIRSNTTVRIDASRRLMYDRYGNVVVDNELENYQLHKQILQE